MGNSNSQGKPKPDQPEVQEGEIAQDVETPADGKNSPQSDALADANGNIVGNVDTEQQEIQTSEDTNIDNADNKTEENVDIVTDRQYTSRVVETKATLLDLAADTNSNTDTTDVGAMAPVIPALDPVIPASDPAASEPPVDSPHTDIDVESTAAETQSEKTAYVDLQEVSRGEGSPIPEAIPEVDEECSDDEGELSEDKRFETVMRVVIHSINDIERSTDIGSEIDPFVEVRANQVLLGATKPKTDMTTASVEESFYIKTERNPRSIKLKFHLKDEDHMTDDDLLGHGYFDLAEEDNTMNQTVHLKWKGKEIGNILISVDFQNLVVM